MALAGLVVEEVSIDGSTVSVRARSSRCEGRCPLCGAVSWSLYSRDERRLLDLPAHGREVAVLVLVRPPAIPSSEQNALNG
jgi:hypothetical protein